MVITQDHHNIVFIDCSVASTHISAIFVTTTTTLGEDDTEARQQIKVVTKGCQETQGYHGNKV